MEQEQASPTNSIHRLLVKRLVIATLAISVVVALAVNLFERQRVVDSVVDRALQRSTMFSSKHQGLLNTPEDLNRPGLQQAFAQLTDTSIKSHSGYFVFAELYDDTSTPIAEFTDTKFAHIDIALDWLRTNRYAMPAAGTYSYHGSWLASRPFVHVAVPLTNREGTAVAWLQGVYAVSQAAGDELSQRVLRSVLIAIAIVLLTTTLLYPVILLLIRKLNTFSSHLLEANLDMLQVLGSAIAKRDSDTSEHNFRVTIIAVRIAETIKLPSAEIQSLIKGAFLHDVGKIGITDSILLKPGRLDADEFSIMKTHVNHGLDIIKRSVWLKDAAAVVGGHHEKCDGSGYPLGSKRHDIPISARIFAIADVFDALASKRPYKEPFSFDESMRILKEGSGSHFDPEILDAFTGIARELHDHLTGRDSEELRIELGTITRRYFSPDADTLRV